MTSRTGVWVLLVSFACATDDVPLRVTTVDTLASGAVVVQNVGTGLWNDSTAWHLVEKYRVGDGTSDKTDVFSRLWALTSDRRDRLYALDRNAREVRVYDLSGGLEHVLGGDGDGPGEFRNPAGLAWDRAGRLWVLDPLRSRYVVWDTSGLLHLEYPRQVLGFSQPWAGWFDREGYLYEQLYPRDGSRPVAQFRVGDGLQGVDTLDSTFQGIGDWDIWDLGGRSTRIVAIPIPFGRGPRWTVHNDGSLWVGHTSSYTLARRNVRGDTLQVVIRFVDPIPIAGAEHDSAARPYSQNVLVDVADIPTTKPLFEDLSVDSVGYLWVLRAGPDQTWFFDVFEPEGLLLGSVRLPVTPWLGLAPRIGESHLWVTTVDTLDVQTIICFEIVRP